MWEVRVFTGTDQRGRPTQLSRTVRGGKRDALRLAAELETGKGQARPAGRFVSDVLDGWVEQSLATWAPSSARDQQSRVASIKKDPIVRIPLARLTVADVERFAAMYGKARRSFIRLGEGMTRLAQGGQALRAVALLPGVTGAYGRKGGGALLLSAGSCNLNYNAVRKPSGPATTRTINHLRLGEDLLSLRDDRLGSLLLLLWRPSAALGRPDPSALFIEQRDGFGRSRSGGLARGRGCRAAPPAARRRTILLELAQVDDRDHGGTRPPVCNHR